MIMLEYIAANKTNINGFTFIILYIILFVETCRAVEPNGLPQGIEEKAGGYCFWCIFMCTACIDFGIYSIIGTMHYTPIAGIFSFCIAVILAFFFFKSVVAIATFTPGSLGHAKFFAFIYPFLLLAIGAVASAISHLFPPAVTFSAAAGGEPLIAWGGACLLYWPWALYFHFSKNARAVWG